MSGDTAGPRAATVWRSGQVQSDSRYRCASLIFILRQQCPDSVITVSARTPMQGSASDGTVAAADTKSCAEGDRRPGDTREGSARVDVPTATDVSVKSLDGAAAGASPTAQWASPAVRPERAVAGQCQAPGDDVATIGGVASSGGGAGGGVGERHPGLSGPTHATEVCPNSAGQPTGPAGSASSDQPPAASSAPRVYSGFSAISSPRIAAGTGASCERASLPPCFAVLHLAFAGARYALHAAVRERGVQRQRHRTDARIFMY